MTTLFIIIGIVVIFILYRSAGSEVKAVSGLIADRLGVKRHLVEDMICKMGVEWSQRFTRQMKNETDSVLRDGVYTFFIYQIIMNPHPENVKWWQEKLVENGLKKELDIEPTQFAFIYLENIGIDFGEMNTFMDSYNEQFCDS